MGWQQKTGIGGNLSRNMQPDWRAFCEYQLNYIDNIAYK
jgi:hypothetical protein